MTQAVYTWAGTGGTPGRWQVDGNSLIIGQESRGEPYRVIARVIDGKRNSRGIAAVPDLVAALSLVNGMLREFERRAEDADSLPLGCAQAAFDAFIGAEDSAEIWVKVRAVLKRVGVTVP